MTRILLLGLLFTGCLTATAQELPSRRAIKKEVRAWQKEQNHEMATEGSSPMDSAARVNFTKLPFYPINLGAYQAVKWERCADSAWFEMPTTTARKPIYRKYATLYFTHADGQTYSLTAYQSQALLDKEEYVNYLFVPFGDATNGTDTYGGGRYVEVTRGEWILDFNKAYNPYCAYSGRYSCPKVPLENILPIPILAGTKYVGQH
ncbi:MAG: DUF1684 domain-containing protein [Flavobacteriia bacterium]|jgi:uncharacterized protein (DUF1684 family)|nr:DUF1684 domain-containing protein [Flavobacteriia bacterium]NDD50247.1 DUF1684 domain-containing protein [Flavobacteriia bacterium]